MNLVGPSPIIITIGLLLVAIILDITAPSFANPAAIEQPSCDIPSSDGLFPVSICKGEEPNGRCFCCGESNTATGVRRSRIFGWSWSSVEKINCACSRQRHKLEERNGEGSSSLHCTENGNYDQLQCDNGLCWCVVPISGQPTERFYPQSMMRYLPCYSNRSIDLQHNYRRHCESKALARLTVLGKLEAHGTFNSHIDMPRCDHDGSFSARIVNKTQVNCVWKDGKKIDNYQSSTVDFFTTNCYCARDSLIYSQENMAFLMSCGGNGNYENSQSSNGRPFCVDNDGFATTQIGSIGDVLTCP